MSNKNSNNMTGSAKVSYVLGAFGNDFFYFALATLLITFISTQLFEDQIYVVILTTIIMILRIAELFIDPFIGNMIDRTNTKFGKFRPWVLIGGTVCSICLCILFTNMGGLSVTNPILYIVLFSVLYLIMDIFYSSKDIGFWSMLPALTLDNKEREGMATIARVGSSIGNACVNMVAMPIVLFFSAANAGNDGDTNGWLIFGFIVCAVSIFTSLLVFLFTREKESKIRENKEETKGVSAVLKMLVKNDQLMWIAIPYICYCIGTMVLTQLQLLYFTYILQDSSIYTQMSFFNMFVGVAAVLLYPVLMKFFKRRTLFICGIVMMLCGVGLYVLAGDFKPLVIVAAELFYFPQQIMFLIVLMIITDCVEYGQLKLGHRDESLALAVRPLVDKLGSAIATGVVGYCAVLTGIQKDMDISAITDSGVMTFKIIMFAIPAVLLVLSLLIFLKKSTLTEKKHAEIVKELEATWGKEGKKSEN